MEEIWKDIKGYEGNYQVSNLGRIRSLDRHIKYRNVFCKGQIVKQLANNKGYYYVRLSRKKYYVHRLVALAFVKNNNPSVNKVVDHIDSNKTNNCSSNLRWCTQKQNMDFAKEKGCFKYTNERLKKHKKIFAKFRKSIYSKNVLTGEINHYESINAAGKLLGSAGNICLCLKGKMNTYKGCKFYYE